MESIAPAEGSAAQSSVPPTQPQVQSAPQPQIKLWNPPASSGTSALGRNNLPDEYFKPTAAELSSAFAAQRKAREALVDAPLKTSAIRAREEKAKLERWPQVGHRYFWFYPSSH